MVNPAPDDALRFQNVDDASRLRDRLVHANFTNQGVVDLIGQTDLSSVIESKQSEYLHRTSGGSPLETLVRLFVIGIAVDVQDACQAVAPLPLQVCTDAGLLHVDNNLVTSAVGLLPIGDLYIAFDTLHRLQLGRPDYVMGVGKSTLNLANITIHQQCHQSLDLGTGSGFLAFLAASHSERTFAVDRNPRAIQFAQFNAQLNGISNIVLRTGDLFEPIQGETFDLVVSNPPFVISPENQYIYRDSGFKGDEVCQQIIRQVPPYLSEGGYCQILCNWAHLKGQDWQERLAAWFTGTGCDAMVLRVDTSSPEVYANTWIQHTEQGNVQRDNHRLEQWLSYYKQQDIEAFSAGIVVLRRRSNQPNWFVADDYPGNTQGPCGHEILRWFLSKDYLQAHQDDRDLINAILQLSPDAQLTQQSQPNKDGGWRVAHVAVSRVAGFVHRDEINPIVANFLGQFDGQRPLSELITEVAHTLGQTPDDVSKKVLSVVRQLVLQGILVPTTTRSKVLP